jgi:diguanylate cyclase (GGDEF)-like protein/PAS domain S-box-containing protein
MADDAVPTLADRWGSRLPIRRRLSLLLLALAVPFVLYVGLSAWRQAQQEEENVRQRMLAVSKLTTARLDEHVGSIRQLLSALTQSVGTTRADRAANSRMLRRLAPRLPAQIHNIAVWDINGDNLGALSPGLDHLNLAHRSFFRDALATNDLAVEAPAPSITSGEPVGVFALAIERDGRIVGVVSASTPLKPLQNLLAPENMLVQGAVVTVFNRNGIVLARSLEADKWIGRSLQSVVSLRVDDMVKTREGVRDGPGADGVVRIAGYSTAERVPWLVYVGTPREGAMAPVRSRLLENLLAGGLMLLIGVVVAALVGETIASPLRHLSRDAEALQQGDLSHRSMVSQGGEIGQLAATVNRMADALQERATALQTSQEQLKQVTDNIPAMISYLDTEQRFRFANRLYFDWMGTDPTDMLGRSLREFYGEEAYSGFRHHIENALAGKRVTYERLLATPGRPRHVQVSVVPHQNAEGKVQGLYVLMQDVTEARELEAQRARSEERLQLALEGSDQALFDWDVARDVVYLSAQAAVLRGLPGEESITSPSALREFVHPDDLQTVVERQRAALTGAAEAYEAEFRIRTRNGQWVWLRGRGRVVERDHHGRARRLAGTYVDITRRRAVEERLRHMAEFDSLTGLPNRAQFNDRLLEAMQRTEAGGKPMALLFLDIDHFKLVNDTLGHETGDDVLKVFARVLESAVRTTDTVARLAGDEFTVVLDGIGHTDDARAVAQNLVTRARRTVRIGERSVEVSTSIGIAIFHGGELDPASLLRRADLALYKAKRQGRNGYAMDDDRSDAAPFAA